MNFRIDVCLRKLYDFGIPRAVRDTVKVTGVPAFVLESISRYLT